MRIRRDPVAVSSVLFTVALLMLMPTMLGAAATVSERGYWVHGIRIMMQGCFAPTGFASLAVIVIGLIVTWAGYIKGVRWTWFVMFVIVWLWAFPVLMLPFFYPWESTASIAQTMASTPANAISESGLPRGFVEVGCETGLERTFVEVGLVFLLMVVALVLPVKTFILGRGGSPGGPERTNLGAPDKRTLPEI